MSVKWTNEQQRAISAHGKNILVSAAAGSGKTAVLVERVIRRITDAENPVMIDRLLIVTFTNAAANGMQIKIREALKKLLDEQGENEHIAKQLALLPRATITTVHSFCQDFIRNNFLAAGLSASFEIGDETQLAILQDKALNEVLDKWYENPAPEFEVLVDGFGGKRDDSRLAGIIMNIYRFTQSTAHPRQWLMRAKDNFYNGGFEMWSRFALDSLKEEIKGMIYSYDSAIDVIGSSAGIERYYESFASEREMLENLLEKCGESWDNVRLFAEGIQFGTLPRKSKDADDTSAAYVQKIRNNVKSGISKMRDIFYAAEEEIKSDNAAIGKAIGVLCDIVWDFTERYSALKRDKNLVDFNDLEHFALKLTENAEISEQIKNKFDEVLVDEYQDTNGVQEALFQAVSKNDNLFMVGDVKQSIYGFRNAQPSIFTLKAQSYESNPLLGELIHLSHNFRSDKGIIDFVNDVFCRIMSVHVGNIDYEKGHRLVYGGGDPVKKAVELHIIEKKMEDSDGFTEEERLTNDIMREAMFVARRIVSLVEVERPVVRDGQTGESRRIQYRDIAILARKNKGLSDIFTQQLAALGVPFYCEDEKGDYIISLEISVIISFLSIIDNPMQDIPLIAVMRSPLFLFTDEELGFIRSLDDRSFYHAVCACEDEKCKSFLATLEHYRQISKEEKIEFLIRKILNDTGFLSFVATLPDGETKVANLRLLCERAGKFEADRHRTIFEFLNYINAMKEHSHSYSVAKTTGQNDNVVKVMSVHKSKGLEFPAVFFVRCGESFNKTDLRENLQYDIELGIGCDFTDYNRGIKYPNISKLAIVQKKLYNLLSEEMRIMYVALTRAKHMLFIVGSCTNAQKKLCEWENSNTLAYTVAKQNTYLDWLGIALGGKIREIAGIHTAEEVLIQGRGEAVNQTAFAEETAAEEYSPQLAERLEYKYPYSDAKYIPSKLPVSRAIAEVQYEINLKKPEFIQRTEKMSAAVRGTIIHFVLQNIDLERTDTKGQIEEQLAEMARRGMIDREFIGIVDAGRLERFFKSDIGLRMKKSGRVEREVKFFVDIPAREIVQSLDESVADETILLQGVVDCYFVEDGQLVIVDYKTGRSDRAEYEKQLEFYAKGLSKMLGMKVKETVLYPLI